MTITDNYFKRPGYKVANQILMCWALFSLMYWISAYYKPFHVDEFYSWVYAERCSFKEILFLKGTGIGHPPLFHLIQKLVQAIFQDYNPLTVRLANYIIGSAFIILLIRMLSRYKTNQIFYYGICSSACLLDVFVFSRMWGLVCFSSLLLLWSGEKYVKNDSYANMFIFFGTYFLGIFSDYNFILLFPYLIFVLFSRKPYLKKLMYVSLISLTTVWIVSSYIHSHMIQGGLKYFIFGNIESLTKVTFAMGLLLFNFWFYETFMIALLVILLSSWFSLRKMKKDEKNIERSPYQMIINFIILMLVLFTLHALLFDKSDFLFRWNHLWEIRTVIFLLIIAVVSIFVLQDFNKIRVINITSFEGRLVISIIAGLLILLSVNPFFWRGLIKIRFVIALFPYILFLIYRNYSKKTLNVISIVFFLSGLLYISSTAISDHYPAPFIEEGSPVIFQDELAYSTQYLRNGKDESVEPFFINPRFNEFCKVCKMGTENIPYDSFDTVRIVSSSSDPSKFIPPDFILYDRKDNLTWSDKWQFKYFTTSTYEFRFNVFEYHRVPGSAIFH